MLSSDCTVKALLGYNKTGNVLQRDIEARSHIYFCSGRVTTVRYSECVCSLIYPASIAHAPYYFVFCGLSVSTVIFHIFTKKEAKFFKKKLWK